MKRSSAIAALFVAATSLAADYEWVNVKTVPDDLINTAYGWSAVRIEDDRFQSHRCAADDFVIEKTTQITEIGYWNVEIGDPPYRNGEWYIFTNTDDGPGKLLFAGPEADDERTDTGWDSKSFGTIYETRMPIENVALEPGTYWLAFRTYQGFNQNGEKNTVGALTTQFDQGSQGYWSFDVPRDGEGGSWQPMHDFTLHNNDQWAFYIRGTIEVSVRGDMNCDDAIDFADIDGFVLALTGKDAYEAEYPNCNFDRADVNCDSSVDFNDIDGFVECIINGGCADCP